MPNPSRLRIFYLSHLSTPSSDRPIYRAICRHRPQRILGLGIGLGQRALRMIEVASRFQPTAKLQFAGIDLFEARSSADGPGVTLKMAHRLLSGTGARVQLIPGDPATGLAQVANTLGQVDLVVISARLHPQSLAAAWFSMPRLLHAGTQVFWESMVPGGGTSLRLLSPSEIGRLAEVARPRQVA